MYLFLQYQEMVSVYFQTMVSLNIKLSCAIHSDIHLYAHSNINIGQHIGFLIILDSVNINQYKYDIFWKVSFSAKLRRTIFKYPL